MLGVELHQSQQSILLSSKQYFVILISIYENLCLWQSFHPILEGVLYKVDQLQLQLCVRVHGDMPLNVVVIVEYCVSTGEGAGGILLFQVWLLDVNLHTRF